MDNRAAAIITLLTFLTSSASASCLCTLTPMGAGTPPATAFLKIGNCTIDYTAVAHCKDPTCVQFKDLSKGPETSITWCFGDGKTLSGTNITPALKNPVHKFPKKGMYIGMLAIKVKGYKNQLWLHKTVYIK